MLASESKPTKPAAAPAPIVPGNISWIIGDACPQCGRTEEEHKFERIRRITGYLVGTTDRFNNAKQSEEKERVKHGLAE